jgi:hypothetical protein
MRREEAGGGGRKTHDDETKDEVACETSHEQPLPTDLVDKVGAEKETWEGER